MRITGKVIHFHMFLDFFDQFWMKSHSIWMRIFLFFSILIWFDWEAYEIYMRSHSKHMKKTHFSFKLTGFSYKSQSKKDFLIENDWNWMTFHWKPLKSHSKWLFLYEKSMKNDWKPMKKAHNCRNFQNFQKDPPI